MEEKPGFGLLGPLLVHHDGVVVSIPSGRQRTLLAALLLNGGRLIQADELIEVVWGTAPPPSARVSLHNYVRRLRQGLNDSDHSRILTRPRGYLISMAADELDVSRFEALLRTARAAARAGTWEQAAASARSALSLWRGEPLADVESELLVRREVPRLAEMWLQAQETRLDADLRLGRHADLVPELRHLVAAHPLREQLHALLMLALYGAAERAEALSAYQDARRVMIEELGTEPGTVLREVHQRILQADPSLSRPEPTASLSPPRLLPARQPPVTRTLPGAVSHFAGRERELAELTGLLARADEEASGAVVISAIAGTAGVGKTAFAVHWAHQVAGRFPDGQLYVNLRGFDPVPPMEPAEALAGFLRALGLPSQEIPPGVDELVLRYRSLLAGRRTLVLLDNAGSAEQVRPLLPATAGCMALVTSRDSLAGLVARDGAQRLDLDLLPTEDGVWLLRALIGERAAAEPDATRALTVLCARLPLALRVAAERAAAYPGVPLAAQVAELADERRRLDLLDAGGDSRTAVRTVFSWSYRHLEPAAARAFRLMALHPGPDLDAHAAAALAGTTLEQAGQLLGQLARAYLIHPSGPGRYAQHDLLRAYARELALSRETSTERDAALNRLFDHYLHVAAVASRTLYPADQSWRPAVPSPLTPVPAVTSPAAAQAWLDAERATLVAIAAHGSPRHVIDLAASLFRYLDTGGYFPEAIAVYSCALRVAREAGDSRAEAEALRNLSTVDLRQGRYLEAADHLRQALARFRAAGHRPGEGRTLGALGIVAMQQGDYQQAAVHFEEAGILLHAAGDQTGEARVLGNLGIIAMQQGRYQHAVAKQRQALAIFRAIGDRSGEAHGLSTLGNIRRRQERPQAAASHFQQALTLFREIGDRSGEAYALTDLADVDICLGRSPAAIDHHEQSLVLFRDTGDPAGQAKALDGLGEALLAGGRAAEACARHSAALELARQLDDRYEQARAHAGLGHAHQALGDLGQAVRCWQQALALYTDLGTPEAEQIRARLTAVAGSET